MARKLRRDEFEARQRQLPADLRRNVGGANLAIARVDLTETPLGSPPQCVDVRSVYDTRPINAFDFNISASQVNTSTDQAALVATMTVPEGFVAVLRHIDVWFEPNPPGLNRSDYTWTLQLNGGDYPYNLNVPMGIQVLNENVFLIGDEFNVLGLKVKRASGLIPASTTLYTRFYGNFLLKGGRPAALEIGNPVLGEHCAAPPVTVRRPPLTPKQEPRLPDPPALLPPVVTGPAVPPWPVAIHCTRIELPAPSGVTMLYTPVKQSSGAWIALTDAEKNTYAQYLASLPKPSTCQTSLQFLAEQVASSTSGRGPRRMLIIVENGKRRSPTNDDLSRYGAYINTLRSMFPGVTWV